MITLLLPVVMLSPAFVPTVTLLLPDEIDNKEFLPIATL